jgi:hypothetical protein
MYLAILGRFFCRPSPAASPDKARECFVMSTVTIRRKTYKNRIANKNDFDVIAQAMAP